MSTGTTYTLTDRFGTAHERYSAGHAQPRYPFAVVRYDSPDEGATFRSPGKAGVSYHGSRHLADVEASRIRNAAHLWHRSCLVDVIATVATPGRTRSAK